jgi:DNA-binding MarR family transcriptional regulator
MTVPARRDLAASLQHFGLERDRMRAALARRAGISQTDLDALEHLEAAGPLTQRELGERLSLSSGAVTMLVDRLEAAGFVHRRPHPTDRRYVLLELSAQALQRAPAGLAAFHAAITDLVATVPADHGEIISSFLLAAADAAALAAGRLAGQVPDAAADAGQPGATRM